MEIIARPSPNCDARPEGAAIDMLVLHYTGMKTAEEALTRLCDPEARVSAHYTIDRGGRIYRHVDEAMRAWHAGVSFWAGERNVNARSIGIELVNPGHEFGYVPFAIDQIAALIDLAGEILQRHPIPPARVLGHSDVAPTRKTDPGELFPWREIADLGIGLFPCATSRAAVPQMAQIADMLGRLGYGLPPHTDWPLDSVVTAFQRHFQPEKVDGKADAQTHALLAALLAEAA